MPELPSLICPSCEAPIAAVERIDKVRVATRFEDCLRRCEPCGIAASNAASPQDVTFIYRDPLGNIPIASRDGASEALGQAINVRNRASKRSRFGFSTSEDAVTWVVFTYLLRSGQLLRAISRAGLIAKEALTNEPTLLLWGAPIIGTSRGEVVRRQLSEQCASLEEDPNSFSEPDVIVDLGDYGLIFIEVKYRSGNDMQPAQYRGWEKYKSSEQLTWRFQDVKASGCYELARNWCLLKRLAGDRPASLVNLGPARLFSGSEGKRLDRFINALGSDKRLHFKKTKWPDLLGETLSDAPDWFVQFCSGRGLMS